MASGAERVRLTRKRRRRGVIPLHGVEVTEQEVDFLRRPGYDVRLDDRLSLAQAVSSFLGDSALEAMA